MSKHTPGPWEIDPQNSQVILPAKNPRFPNATISPLAYVYPRSVGSNNALLIAAAPDMLEALERCASYLGEMDLDSEEWGDAEGALAESRALAVIAKAKSR